TRAGFPHSGSSLAKSRPTLPFLRTGGRGGRAGGGTGEGKARRVAVLRRDMNRNPPDRGGGDRRIVGRRPQGSPLQGSDPFELADASHREAIPYRTTETWSLLS